MGQVMNFRLRPLVDLSSGRITLEETFDSPPPMDLFRERFTATVVDTREKATRNALICLGWTPPATERGVAPVSDEARLRARAHDPASSVLAADRAAVFAGGHQERILRALGTDELSSRQVAIRSGLTVVQVDRRMHELRRAGKAEVVTAGGEDVLRDGCRVWRRVRLPAN